MEVEVPLNPAADSSAQVEKNTPVGRNKKITLFLVALGLLGFILFLQCESNVRAPFSIWSERHV